MAPSRPLPVRSWHAPSFQQRAPARTRRSIRPVPRSGADHLQPRPRCQSLHIQLLVGLPQRTRLAPLSRIGCRPAEPRRSPVCCCGALIKPLGHVLATGQLLQACSLGISASHTWSTGALLSAHTRPSTQASSPPSARAGQPGLTLHMDHIFKQ
jgi:hypothetical protein